jgi:hypothetical protein
MHIYDTIFIVIPLVTGLIIKPVTKLWYTSWHIFPWKSKNKTYMSKIGREIGPYKRSFWKRL